MPWTTKQHLKNTVGNRVAIYARVSGQSQDAEDRASAAEQTSDTEARKLATPVHPRWAAFHPHISRWPDASWAHTGPLSPPNVYVAVAEDRTGLGVSVDEAAHGEAIEMVFDAREGLAAETEQRDDVVVVTSRRVMRYGAAGGGRVVSVVPLSDLASVGARAFIRTVGLGHGAGGCRSGAWMVRLVRRGPSTCLSCSWPGCPSRRASASRLAGRCGMRQGLYACTGGAMSSNCRCGLPSPGEAPTRPSGASASCGGETLMRTSGQSQRRVFRRRWSPDGQGCTGGDGGGVLQAGRGGPRRGISVLPTAGEALRRREPALWTLRTAHDVLA